VCNYPWSRFHCSRGYAALGTLGAITEISMNSMTTHLSCLDLQQQFLVWQSQSGCTTGPVPFGRQSPFWVGIAS
jgi:hypothetical protein